MVSEPNVFVDMFIVRFACSKLFCVRVVIVKGEEYELIHLFANVFICGIGWRYWCESQAHYIFNSFQGDRLHAFLYNVLFLLIKL